MAVRNLAILLGTTALLLGCVTHIEPQDQSQTAPTVPLAGFKTVYFAQMAAGEHPGFSQAAADKVEKYLRGCMATAFGNTLSAPLSVSDKSHALLITPAILDAKKVSTAKRIFFGPLAGSSAALLQTTYTDLPDDNVVARPIFYAKAAAMSGGMTLGIEDNLMLQRLANDACAYSRNYLGKPTSTAK